MLNKPEKEKTILSRKVEEFNRVTLLLCRSSIFKTEACGPSITRNSSRPASNLGTLTAGLTSSASRIPCWSLSSRRQKWSGRPASPRPSISATSGGPTLGASNSSRRAQPSRLTLTTRKCHLFSDLLPIMTEAEDVTAPYARLRCSYCLIFKEKRGRIAAVGEYHLKLLVRSITSS